MEHYSFQEESSPPMVPYKVDIEKILAKATAWNIPPDHPERLCGTDEA